MAWQRLAHAVRVLVDTMITPSGLPMDPSLRGTVATPVALHLLSKPLDYILAEHMRLRAVCAMLRRFADDGAIARNDADMIRRYLETDLPLHRQDEEADLFPLLRKHARSVDDLRDTLVHLAQDHQRMQMMQLGVIEALGQDANRPNVVLSGAAIALLRNFADSEHRHIAIENGIVLAIARTRLNAKYLIVMATSMKARREAKA